MRKNVNKFQNVDVCLHFLIIEMSAASSRYASQIKPGSVHNQDYSTIASMIGVLSKKLPTIAVVIQLSVKDRSVDACLHSALR